ncbi:hypothetical protein [Cyanothece sp. BG0011]|uniref:hypothetical protein n=1 Tax=Cyanothece sp. BG0011 TaxID=2082950 RepID=UPI000D1D77D6|nr:hypothetical protein [Cyanothece sp. BG0011]
MNMIFNLLLISVFMIFPISKYNSYSKNFLKINSDLVIQLLADFNRRKIKPKKVIAQLKQANNQRCSRQIQTRLIYCEYNTMVNNGREVERPERYGIIRIYLQQLEDNYRNYGPRPIGVEGFIYPVDNVGSRPFSITPSSGFNTVGYSDIDIGHIGALQLGFPHTPENAVPQWALWQRIGQWRGMERHLYNQAVNYNRIRDNNLGVYLRIDVNYCPINSITPTFTRWSFPALFTITTWTVPFGTPVQEIHRRHPDISFNIVGDNYQDTERCLERMDPDDTESDGGNHDEL